MIDITYKSIKAAPSPTKNWPYVPPGLPNHVPPPAANNEQGTLWLQTRARDNIIKKLAGECLYVEGEVVTCHNAETRKAHGDFIIVDKICDSYAKYGKKNDWPANNLPMIVTAHAQGKAGSFFCTPGFLIPLNADGTIPEDKK